MTEGKISISIIKGESNRELINTDGYLLFYLNKETIITLGNIELKALAPILMKLIANKMTGG